MAVKYDLYENGIKVATDINTGYEYDKLGDETVHNYHVESYNSVGDDTDSNVNSGWANNDPLLTITWDTQNTDTRVTISSSMEYTNDGGSTWNTITGSMQVLPQGTGPYELRETEALGAVTKCAFDYDHGSKGFNGNMTVVGGFNLNTAHQMFSYMVNLQTLDITGMYSSNITDMSQMFMACAGITTLDTTNLDTSKVGNMAHMFSACYATDIDISNFDVSFVRSMNSMFASVKLTSLDLTGWSTILLNDVYGMFSYSDIEDLNLTDFSFDKINLDDMFHRYESCINLNLTNADFSSMVDIDFLFNGYDTIVNLNLTNADFEWAGDASHMFRQTTSLKVLNMHGALLTRITNHNSMFQGAINLEELDLSDVNFSLLPDINNLFQSMSKLKHINLTNWIISQTRKMMFTFDGCTALTCITNIDSTSPVTDKDFMFRDTPALIQPDTTSQTDITDADGANWVNANPCP